MLLFALLAQAVLPPPGLHYFERTEYKGPGLVCGAAFAFRLRNGETAVLRKRTAIDAITIFHTPDGEFSVQESQYATAGGKVVQNLATGIIRRKRQNGEYTWIYEDVAPGSTDVSGPAVNSRTVTPTFKRILFGGPRNDMVGGERCMTGVGFEERQS
jgi:hypothetical protein